MTKAKKPDGFGPVRHSPPLLVPAVAATGCGYRCATNGATSPASPRRPESGEFIRALVDLYGYRLEQMDQGAMRHPAWAQSPRADINNLGVRRR